MKKLLLLLLFPTLAHASPIICTIDKSFNTQVYGEDIGDLCARYINLIDYIHELVEDKLEQEIEVRKLKRLLRRRK